MYIKKHTKLLIILIAIVLILGTTGCGTKEDVESPYPVTIGGAALAGTYYAMAAGWSNMITEQLNVHSSVEATGGASDNIILVHEGTLEFGLATSGTAYEMFEENDNIRGLFSINPLYFQFWTPEESGIKTLNDLNGKRVNLSRAGSAADVWGRYLIEILDIKPSDITNVDHGQASNMMRDRLLDVAFTVGGAPHPAIDEMSTLSNVTVIGVSEEEHIRKVLEISPQLAVGIVPMGSYKGQQKEFKTIVDYNFMMANKDLPEDLIYDAVKATFENKISLEQSLKDWEALDINNVEGIPIPLHSGAIKYYKEQGIAVE